MALDRVTYSRENRRLRRFNSSYVQTARECVADPEQIATRDNRHELRRQC